MANNQKKLKAFVRYDGSGRVVAGSLILRKNKPRVGRWFEIPTYQCCNGDTSTTTSTTTVAPTTTTTTTLTPSTTTTTTTAAPVSSFQVNFVTSIDASAACITYSGGPITTMYSNVSTLVPGSVLYNDSALTDPWSGGGTQYWFAVNNNGTISSMQVGRVADGNTGIILSIAPCA
jgi:hypothetical protein